MTVTEQQVTSSRLRYVRNICLNLSRCRCRDANWELDAATAENVRRLIRRQFEQFGANSNETNLLPRGSKVRKASEAAQLAVPEQGEYCGPHLQRTGERRAIHKEGLCRACFDGEAIRQSENYGEGPRVPDGIPQERKPRTPSLAFTLARLEAAAKFGGEGSAPMSAKP